MSITQRIWLLLAAPFVVAIVAYLVATRPLRRELLLREASREMRDDVVVLQSAVAHGVVGDRASLLGLVNALSHAERVVAVAVVGADGALVASAGDRPDEARARELAGRARAAHGEISEVRERSTPPLLEHAVPLHVPAIADGGVVVVTRDIGYVDDLVASWNRKLLAIGAGIALVLLVLSRPLVRKVIGEPLDAVVTGVERVARGELEVEVPAARNDELGRLARAFNAMTHGLLEARRREEEQRARREELEAKMRTVQTLAAAGEIAASLAHEIGSPLNVILGRARMIADRPDTSETTRADLKSIAAQTERISRSIEGFLRVGRPASETPSAVDVQEVVDETLAFLASEARKRRIEMRVVRAAPTGVAGEAGPRVFADRDQLTQIVFNLCLNAMQAQPGGGQIEVRISRATQGDRPFLELAVSDGGPGVPEEIRGRIFDPFFSTKRSGGSKQARGDGGSGLGLAIVDGMVRELGGTVDADDAEPSAGGGARFRVRLPAIPEASPRVPALTRGANGAGGAGSAGDAGSEATGNAAAATPPASTSEVRT
jgi:signal transduction histidine kinase